MNKTFTVFTTLPLKEVKHPVMNSVTTVRISTKSSTAS